ncbi:MAG TPA: addiction module antidote protein [Steroidobacteraceae bacterium]|nr:addiction module antidote protein [Steroidobacteraceae bacterium]
MTKTIRKKASAAKTRTRKYDTASLLHNDREAAAYLEAALAEGDAMLVAAAIGDIARARGMTKIAKETGLGRESLYKALSADGKPGLDTVMMVLNALNIRLHARIAA